MSAERIDLPLPLYTVEEFFDLIQDGQKADLIDGVIHMASPDTPRNDDLGGFLFSIMRFYARGKRLGRVTGSRVAYVLANRRAPEPDVAFVRQERVDRIQRTRVIGPPDIAIEIVSEDSHERDYHQKRRLYEDAGIPEYWLLDPITDHYYFFQLVDGQYQSASLDRNRYFHSAVLPGFWLDVNWLHTEPLPDELDCLQQTLAGPPP